MKVLSALWALSQSFFSPRPSHNGASNLTTINFDDIPTRSGLAFVPSAYHLLHFDLYSVFKPDDPALEGMISEHDLNCAVSSPNALVGSRLYENVYGASFEIANATAMSKEGFHPYFTLHSFYVKPMDAPEPGTTVYVKGYSNDLEEPLLWHVEFPSGYHLPLLVNMEEYSGAEWQKIYKVEITADFGYDALDWEFCMDDLELQFFTASKKEEECTLRSRIDLNRAEM